MPHPDLLHPELLPLHQATVDPYLHRRHSNTQNRSGSVSVESHGAHKVLFEPSRLLWWVRGSDFQCNFISPMVSGASPLFFDIGYLLSMGSNILLSMVVQQQVAILEFLQEKMSARSSLCACTQIPRVDPHSNTLVDKHSRDILHSTNIIIKYHLKWLHSWNKSYDQSRQHIKKQRHHLVDKGPYSQSYGCFSSQVWM